MDAMQCDAMQCNLEEANNDDADGWMDGWINLIDSVVRFVSFDLFHFVRRVVCLEKEKLEPP